MKPERFTAKSVAKLVNGEDVFVIQPTGSGKSLIYQSSPMAMAIDIVKETTFKSIAVVISPLTSLMQDHVKFLKSIAAEFIAEDQNDEGGDCQIVFGLISSWDLFCKYCSLLFLRHCFL